MRLVDGTLEELRVGGREVLQRPGRARHEQPAAAADLLAAQDGTVHGDAPETVLVPDGR